MMLSRRRRAEIGRGSGSSSKSSLSTSSGRSATAYWDAVISPAAGSVVEKPASWSEVMSISLLVSEGLDRTQTRRPTGGIDAEEQADRERQTASQDDPVHLQERVNGPDCE